MITDVPLLVAMLKMSHVFIVAPVRHYAIAALSSLHLDPVYRLHLSINYNVQRWMADTVHLLIDRPLSLFSTQDKEHLGLAAYSAIVETQVRLIEFRRALAVAPPRVPTPTDDGNIVPWLMNDCGRHEECVRVWREVWARVIAPRIINPRRPVPFNEMLIMVVEAGHNGMEPECKQNVLAPLALAGQPMDFFVATSTGYINSCIDFIRTIPF
jgi:hypothetical protein